MVGGGIDRTDIDQMEEFITATSQPSAYYSVLGAWRFPVRHGSIETPLVWMRGVPRPCAPILTARRGSSA